MKTAAKVLLTERAINARNCLSMVMMTPKVLLDDRVVAHIRERLCDFLEERENGHAKSASDARRILTTLSEEIDLPATRLFRPSTSSHQFDRLADVVRDCIATEFPSQRETTVGKKSKTPDVLGHPGPFRHEERNAGIAMGSRCGRQVSIARLPLC